MMLAPLQCWCCSSTKSCVAYWGDHTKSLQYSRYLYFHQLGVEKSNVWIIRFHLERVKHPGFFGGLHPGLWPCSERAGFVHWYLGVGVSVSNGWVGWPFDGGLASMETLRIWWSWTGGYVQNSNHQLESATNLWLKHWSTRIWQTLWVWMKSH